MKIEHLAKGLEILIKEGATGYCLVAEHDEIWAAHELKVSKRAKKQLEDLGWDYDEDDVDAWKFYV